LYDETGSQIFTGSSTAAAKAVIRYRLDGRGRKLTITGANLAAQVRQSEALLTLAYEQNWVADERFRPVAPVALPSVGVDMAGDGAQVLPFPGAATADLPEPAAPHSSAVLPAVGAPTRPADADSLVRWRKSFVETSNSHRRGGGRRSPGTTDNYRTNLDFFLTHARYRLGDPRLDRLGLPAGVPMRLDDPELGLNERDLVALLTLRAATNLRTRAANERAMARWADAMAKEERAAARGRREPVLTAPPELRAESVKPRTIEAFAQAVRSALQDGHLHQKIGYQPWTVLVESQVQRSAMPHYSTKTLPDRDQVHLIAGAMAARWRRSTTADHHPCSVNGARYAALVVFAGREAPRPEESTAARASWLHLDDGDPRIEVQWAEVNHSLPGSSRVRTRVPLKGREVGEIRVVRLQPDTADALRRHIENFVPRPNPNGVTEDERDPRLFTTHSGAPIDLGNFSEAWFKPAVALAFASPGDQHLSTMPFRRLRAAAITDWIVSGASSGEASEKAGNSAAVIEKHYRGVFDSRPRAKIAPGLPKRGDDFVVDRLDDVQLAELSQRVMAERRHRLERDS
jgi:hypothetical protein